MIGRRREGSAYPWSGAGANTGQVVSAYCHHHCGPSNSLLQKPDFLLVHTAHLWYTGMGAAPCSEKTQKVLKKTSKWRHLSSWDQDPRTF